MIGLEDPQVHNQEQWQHEALDAISANDWKAKNKKHVEEFSKYVDALILAENEAQFRTEIFANLHFAEQDDRFYSISKPNEESFKWVFDPQSPQEGSFRDWLGDTSGRNVFWMSGALTTTLHTRHSANSRAREAGIWEKHDDEVFVPKRRVVPVS